MPGGFFQRFQPSGPLNPNYQTSKGSLLGLFLFLVLIDDVGFEDQSNNAGDLITKKQKVNDMNVIHLKCVDDLARAEGIDMKT